MPGYVVTRSQILETFPSDFKSIKRMENQGATEAEKATYSQTQKMVM